MQPVLVDLGDGARRPFLFLGLDIEIRSQSRLPSPSSIACSASPELGQADISILELTLSREAFAEGSVPCTPSDRQCKRPWVEVEDGELEEGEEEEEFKRPRLSDSPTHMRSSIVHPTTSGERATDRFAVDILPIALKRMNSVDSFNDILSLHKAAIARTDPTAAIWKYQHPSQLVEISMHPDFLEAQRIALAVILPERFVVELQNPIFDHLNRDAHEALAFTGYSWPKSRRDIECDPAEADLILAVSLKEAERLHRDYIKPDWSSPSSSQLAMQFADEPAYRQVLSGLSIVMKRRQKLASIWLRVYDLRRTLDPWISILLDKASVDLPLLVIAVVHELAQVAPPSLSAHLHGLLARLARHARPFALETYQLPVRWAKSDKDHVGRAKLSAGLYKVSRVITPAPFSVVAVPPASEEQTKPKTTEPAAPAEQDWIYKKMASSHDLSSFIGSEPPIPALDVLKFIEQHNRLAAIDDSLGLRAQATFGSEMLAFRHAPNRSALPQLPDQLPDSMQVDGASTSARAKHWLMALRYIYHRQDLEYAHIKWLAHHSSSAFICYLEGAVKVVALSEMLQDGPDSIWHRCVANLSKRTNDEASAKAHSFAVCMLVDPAWRTAVMVK